MLVSFCETNTYSAKTSQNIMTMIVATQHKPQADQIFLGIKIFVKVLTRASVSETRKTCGRTAVNSGVNSGKPKFQFHIGISR